MGFTSIWHWIIVLAVVLILFARPGKISGIMGDFGKGLRNFRQGMREDGSAADADEEVDVIEAPAAPAAKTKAAPKKKAAKKKAASKTAAKKPAAKKSAAKKAKKKAAKKG